MANTLPNTVNVLLIERSSYLTIQSTACKTVDEQTVLFKTNTNL